MNLRSTLLAATILALPVVANAQSMLDYGGKNAPISGVYLGGAVGANFSQQQNTTITDGPYSASGKFGFNPGFAGKLAVGYGFGNGFRAEIEGSYRYNSMSSTNVLPLIGAANVHGNEQKFAGMINGLYDFNTVSRYVIPYVGVGVGSLVRITSKPFPANTSAVRRANSPDKNRRSYPITILFSVPATGWALQKSAVACETRSRLAKVKSSAITARQPSVPNLI